MKYSKEELFSIMAGDVQATKIELDRARMFVRKSSVYDREWCRQYRDGVKAQLAKLRAELKRCLKRGVVSKPEGFADKL